jgi:hypothetical protein
LFSKQVLPKLVNKIDIVFVEQNLHDLPEGISLPKDRTKPLGTAHAIWCCRHVVDGSFAVINADDYYGENAFSLLLENSTTYQHHHLMVAFQLENTLSDFGGVNRGFCQYDPSDLLLSIEECHDIKRVVASVNKQKIIGQLEHSDSITELEPNCLTSMNCWSFNNDIFPALETYISETINIYFKGETSNNSNIFECYLPKVVMQQITKQNKKVKLLTSTDTWFGLTFIEDLALVEKNITLLHQQNAFATLVDQ